MIQRDFELYAYFNIFRYIAAAWTQNSVGSVQYLRTGDRWFDPRLGQYSFRRLVIVIATGFILFSPLSIVLTMVMGESSLWL